APPAAPAPAARRVFLVFFDWDRSTITAEGRNIVQQAADAYRAGGPVQIQVTGYTDASGSVGYNERLSERHANAVAYALTLLEVHAPLAHAVPGVRRYVQDHIEGGRSRPDIPTTEVAVDGIAELWYDDRAAMERVNASAAAKRLHDDGALFIGGIKTFVIEEK